MNSKPAKRPCDCCEKVHDPDRCSSYRKCPEYRDWFRIVWNEAVADIKLAYLDDEDGAE